MSLKKESVLKICKLLSNNYRNDFKRFVNETINFDGLTHKGLTFQQEDIANNLIKYKDVCVSAGGGIGKSALAALLIIWFLPTHLFSKVPTTAPSRKQLKDVLWSEIAFWIRRFKYKEIFELFTERLTIKGFSEWYAVARTVPKEGDVNAINDTLAGFHGKGDDDLFIVVDEASGVPDPVFTAIEGALTSGAYVLLISNPVSIGGYYYDTINDPQGKGKSYKVLYYDARESPLVSKEFEQRIIDRYGKDSPMYIAKILGKPVTRLQSVVVTPDRFDYTVSSNKLRFDGEIVLSVDVGGKNIDSDPAIFCHKIGASIVRWDEYYGVTPTDIADEILRVYERLYKGKKFKCIVDGIGPGAGVVSNLQKFNRFPVIAFIGSEKSNSPNMYGDKRSEGYYELSKNFEHLHFPAKVPDRLKKELANLFFDLSDGTIKMEPKKKFIGRLGFSPDNADALMMANSVDIAEGIAVCPYVHKRPSKGFRIIKKMKYGDKFSKFVV